MPLTPTATRSTHRRAWSLFDVHVIAARRLTPSMVRVTVAAARPSGVTPPGGIAPDGADAGGRTSLAHFADCGFDQRIKIILPAQPGGEIPLADPENWYRDLRSLPDGRRPAARTYTVRSMRNPGSPDAEIDIDVVLHGTDGPASAWAASAMETVLAGDPTGPTRVTLVGPDARFEADHRGREFVTSERRDLLIAGDETALPAIAAILERLDRASTGTVLIEVPTGYDAIPLSAPAGIKVTFLPRDGARHGDLLVRAAGEWRPSSAEHRARDDGRDGHGAAAGSAGGQRWDEFAWDVPAAGETGAIRAWIAGEAAAVRAIRRHLVGACGLHRNEVAFMGYWRLGRSEG